VSFSSMGEREKTNGNKKSIQRNYSDYDILIK